MSKGSKQRPTDYEKFSNNWDNIFRKEKSMIRTPPQHNTTNPPGQQVNPVGNTYLPISPATLPLQQGKPTRQEIEDFLLDNKPDNSKHGY